MLTTIMRKFDKRLKKFWEAKHAPSMTQDTRTVEFIDCAYLAIGAGRHLRPNDFAILDEHVRRLASENADRIDYDFVVRAIDMLEDGADFWDIWKTPTNGAA